MKEIFDRIIAKLEDISENDEYGKIVDLDEAIEVIYEMNDEYMNNFTNSNFCEKIAWERHVAIWQLNQIGLSLGQKMSGKYLTSEEYNELLEYKQMYEDLCR